MGVFANIAKWALVGTGTILSLIPTVGPVIGAGIISAGLGVRTNTPATQGVDPVSANAQILAQVLQNATAMTNVAAGGSAINVNPIMVFLQKYWMYLVGGLAALWLLPKLFKK